MVRDVTPPPASCRFPLQRIYQPKILCQRSNNLRLWILPPIIKSLRFGIFTVSLTSENFGKAISASKWNFFIFVHCLFYYLC